MIRIASRHIRYWVVRFVLIVISPAFLGALLNRSIAEPSSTNTSDIEEAIQSPRNRDNDSRPLTAVQNRVPSDRLIDRGSGSIALRSRNS